MLCNFYGFLFLANPEKKRMCVYVCMVQFLTNVFLVLFCFNMTHIYLYNQKKQNHTDTHQNTHERNTHVKHKKLTRVTDSIWD